MPSPPPRKVKPVVWLRDVHAKQCNSLQAREQQLLDIIEDIRAYSKQRADVEKLYSQSLLKLSSQFLLKKEIFAIEEQNPNDDNRTLQSAWRSCLEAVSKAGSVRLKAAEVYAQNVSEKCRVLKVHKAASLKRAFDQLSSLQNDLAQDVKDFGAKLKQYTDDEIQAYEARAKASSADQRLNNKDTGLFSSVGTLRKSQAKSLAKMVNCNAQSSSSRNTYLLELAAVNAHTSKLHTKHLPALFKSLDDGVYDQLSSCLSTLAQTEIDCGTEIQTPHHQVVLDCGKVTSQYNLDCFLQANPVFSEQVTFHFEPVQDDPVNYLTTENDEQQKLEKTTQMWARKVARETKSLADLHDKMNQLTNRTTQNPSTDIALEAELLKVQTYIRRGEIAKLKAEARLELLRSADMPVDEILTQVTKEHESIADTHSLTSRDSSLHSFDTFDSSADNLDTLRRHSYIPGTVSDPANWTSLSSLNNNQQDSLSTNQESALFSAQVIYDYTACQQDELNLAEGEVISILDHGSGDGWLKACNSNGDIGMVPENYIERYEDVASLNENNNQSIEEAVPPPPLPVDYSPNAPLPPSVPPPPIDTPVLPPVGIGYVRAICDYAAEGEDEISFAAGQLIVLLSQDENGIDDGYWKGEADGVQGLFPSIVVEEVDMPPPSTASDTQQFNTWEDNSHQYSADNVQPVPPLPPPVEPFNPQSLASDPTASGSYTITQNSSTSSLNTKSQETHNTSIVSSSIPMHNPHFRPVPLPPIPDEDEAANWQLTKTDHSNETMSFATELYPSQPSPRVLRHREARQSPDTPPVLNRNNKPIIKSSLVNGISRPTVQPPQPPTAYSPKPGVDYSRKPALPAPGRQVVPPHSPPEKPVGRRAQRPTTPSSSRVESLPYGSGEQSPAVRPAPVPRASHQSSKELESPDLVNNNNIRNRYYDGHSNRPHALPVEPSYAAVGNEEDVENRRFRHMQPVPHQYYLERSGQPTAKERGASVRGADPVRDRSASDRSFTSFSSADSADDKQTPIRIPGRRHLSSETPSDPPTPVKPLTLQDAARLMPQGLVNPSYRVATMSDMMPSSASRPSAVAHGSKPSSSRRQGGLPGHVRHGIVQGRKMLTEAANDLPNTQHAMKRQSQKSETAV